MKLSFSSFFLVAIVGAGNAMDESPPARRRRHGATEQAHEYDFVDAFDTKRAEAQAAALDGEQQTDDAAEKFERVLFGKEQDEEQEEGDHDMKFVLVHHETGEELSFDDEHHHRYLAKGGSFRIQLRCKKSYKWAKLSCSTGPDEKHNRCDTWCMEYASCGKKADIRIRSCGRSKQKWELSKEKLRPAGCNNYCVNMGGDRLTKSKCGSFSWDGAMRCNDREEKIKGKNKKIKEQFMEDELELMAQYNATIENSTNATMVAEPAVPALKPIKLETVVKRIMTPMHRPCSGEPVRCAKLEKAEKAEAVDWSRDKM